MANRNTNLAYDYRRYNKKYPPSYMHETAAPVYEPGFEPMPIHRRRHRAATDTYSVQHQLFNAKTIMLLMVITALAFTVAFRSAGMTQKTSQINASVKVLNELKAKNEQMRIEIEEHTDLKSIEAFASAELGMTRPEKYQTIYINLNQQDLVEKPAEAETVWEKGYRFLKNLWEYFG